MPRPKHQDRFRFLTDNSVALLTRCSTSAACACCASCTSAARSPRSPTRSSSRRRRSPSSSRCSSARPACRCSSAPGRGVRLTDPALVLVEHADALLERAALAEADLAAAAGHGQRPRAHRRLPVGRAAHRAAGDGGARRARRRGCAASSSRPSPSRRCPRSRSATSTSCSATSGSTSRGGCPPGSSATSCCATRSSCVLPAATRSARRHPDAVPLAELAERAVGDRPRRDGVGGDDAAHLPRARRLRARHPPPHERRDGQPRARRPRARRSRCCPRSRCPAPPRASRCAPSPSARSSRAIFAVTRARRRRAPVDAGAARGGARRG